MATRAFCLCTGTCNTIPQGKGNIENPIKGLPDSQHTPPCSTAHTALLHMPPPQPASTTSFCEAHSPFSKMNVLSCPWGPIQLDTVCVPCSLGDQISTSLSGLTVHNVTERTKASCHAYLCHPSRRPPSMFLVHCHLGIFLHSLRAFQ